MNKDTNEYVDSNGKVWMPTHGLANRFSISPYMANKYALPVTSIEGIDRAGKDVKLYDVVEFKQIVSAVKEEENIQIVAQQLNNHLEELSKENGPNFEAYSQLLGLFGSSMAIDILYATHPEYRSIPVERIKSNLGEYLGNFLINPPPFNLDNIEKGLPLLGENNFQDALYEVIKSSCLVHLHQAKTSNAELSDAQIIHNYLSDIVLETADLNSLDLLTVLRKVITYYDAMYNGFQKPDRLVDELNGGKRSFPDTAQLVNIKEIEDKKRMLIADQMGLGKSGSAILAKEHLGLRQAIIIAPSNVLSTWQRYLSDQVDEDSNQVGYFKPGQTPAISRISGLEDFENPAVANAEYVLISQERMAPEYIEYLKALNADMLIVDEAHKVKNVREGAWSKSVIELANSMQKVNDGDSEKYVVALSGTPIPNKVEDIAISLILLYPEKFAGQDPKEIVSQIIRSDVLTLRSLLVQRMQMKSLSENVEMPPLNEEIMVSELSETEKDLYEVLLEEDELTAGAKMALLRTFLLNPAALDALPSMESTKIQNLESEINSFFATKNKLVVFVNGYIENVIRGEKSFLQHLNLPEGVEVRVIEGNISMPEREKIQQEFKYTDKKILLIVSGQTADVGVDFSPAQGLYEYNEPWTMGEKNQQLGRSYRPGLKNPLDYATFITKGTIEEGIHEYIHEKEYVISKLIKGIPITEIEQQFITEAEKLEDMNLEVNPELAEYYFSSWNKMMKIFASMKEIGGEKFTEFLEKHGEDYAESYAELGSRSYQANVNRVASRVIEQISLEAGQHASQVKIADIASGPEMLRQHTPDEYQKSVVSMDLNPDQFKGKAQGRAIVGDFTKIPLKSGSFDYANLALGIHYTQLVPSKENYERLEVLTEINRILKVGGRAVISFLYSLDLKDEEQFEQVVRAFGLKVVPEFSGEVTSGQGYKTKIYTLEKQEEIKDTIEDIVDILLEGNVDGMKFVKGQTSLKDTRKIIDRFSLNGKIFDIHFNAEDREAYEEESQLINQAEAMKVRARGDIRDIPPEEIIQSGFTRFNNGKRYVLYKRLSKASGSVVIR